MLEIIMLENTAQPLIDFINNNLDDIFYIDSVDLFTYGCSIIIHFTKKSCRKEIAFSGENVQYKKIKDFFLSMCYRPNDFPNFTIGNPDRFYPKNKKYTILMDSIRGFYNCTSLKRSGRISILCDDDKFDLELSDNNFEFFSNIGLSKQDFLCFQVISLMNGFSDIYYGDIPTIEKTKNEIKEKYSQLSDSEKLAIQLNYKGDDELWKNLI